ncbi:MAG: hypothetical protein IJG80_06470, partial [Selenomonadaceae bacterium]|nr:hypothetical protein [Selenomonadaceae bacterium]
RTKNFFPTISLWRGRGEIICDEKVAAIFSSVPASSDEIYHFDLNDLAAAEKICKFLAGFTQCCKSRGRSPRTESRA